MEKFYKRNDLGVDIECYEIARCEENGIIYRIYTNFFNDNNPFGIKLLVDRYVNGQYDDNVDVNKQKELINSFQKEILELVGNNNG